MRSNILWASAVALACVVSGVPANAAGVPSQEAWDFATSGNDFTDGNWDFGAIFTVSSERTAGYLGYYYSQGVDNPVVLYQCADINCSTTAVAIASATVTVDDPILGHFRWAAISPVELLPGVGYEVVGPSGGNNYTWDDSGFFETVNYVHPYGDQWLENGGTAFLPNGTGCCETLDGFWGPNVGMVPEPATWAMFLVGFGMLGFAMRGSRRKDAVVAA